MERSVSQLALRETQTFRPINPGAEKRLGVVTPVLDYGFLYLVDYMGDDHSIVEAARVSYGTGTRKVSEDEGLLRYLMRNRHTSPFEMAELKIHLKLPIVIAAQFVRHRTASLNGLSGRYSVMDKEFYIPRPEDVGLQSLSNRQGRGEMASPEVAEKFRNWLIATAAQGYEQYEEFLDKDNIARELARMGLSQNLYTQWYWKCDLHNIFHFLGLRLDKHAQFEISEYARGLADIVKDAFPLSYKAFEDYQLNAKMITGPETKILETLLIQKNIQLTADELNSAADAFGLKNKREREEMIEKFQAMGLVK